MRKIITALLTLALLAVPLGSSAVAAYQPTPSQCAANGFAYDFAGKTCDWNFNGRRAGYEERVVLQSGESVLFPDGTRVTNNDLSPQTVTAHKP